jgi:glycosyltransferase involved in cell wall biosynthesis
MEILIVNSNDMRGGAARAANRLHRALLVGGVKSRMLVQEKTSDDYLVIYSSNLFQRLVGKVRAKYEAYLKRRYKDRIRTPFHMALGGSSSMVDQINSINPDIVHLHWVVKGTLSVEEIAKIQAPIVWSLHDMWAFTGGCHYSGGCERYEENCGYCKVLGSHTPNDLSRKVFTRKKKIFSKKKMVIVGLSQWISRCAQHSALLKDQQHIHLPNPIDTDVFKPFEKEKSRELWNLPKDKKLVLFGAIKATEDPRKGFRELSEALHKLSDRSIELVVFGSSQPAKGQSFGFKTHYLGHLNDDISLVTLYSAVDVMVVPSLQENLSNAIMESLSCATPVVGFNIGGNSDMIDHKQNGYLVHPFDTDEMARGVSWILDSPQYDAFCQYAREKVLREFDSRIVAEKYIALYRKILNG